MFWVFACWVIGVWNVEGAKVIGSFDSFGVLDVLVSGHSAWNLGSTKLEVRSVWNLELRRC
jgi:hypothetical protein